MAFDRRIAVVGASAGGLEALRALVKGLPQDFAGAMFIVMHFPEYEKSYLAEILDELTELPVTQAVDGEAILPGHIYTSRPGYHLLVDDDTIGVRRGPRENRFRPSIDALFRSAAFIHRERVIGVVLSGMLSDGTSGLWTIKQFGGTTIIQDPDEAAYASMPLSASHEVEIDHMLPVREIGGLIGALARSALAANPGPEKELAERVEKEVQVAASENAFEIGLFKHGELTQFTCPECHGSLVRIKEGPLLRYRCHTGHGFTVNALLSGITESAEELLWNAVRALEEGIMLLDDMAAYTSEHGAPGEVSALTSKTEELRDKAKTLRQQALNSPHLSGDNLAGGRD